MGFVSELIFQWAMDLGFRLAERLRLPRSKALELLLQLLAFVIPLVPAVVLALLPGAGLALLLPLLRG